MESALILGAVLMGLAGAPHCAAMCGAPCAALTRGPGPLAWLPFHLGRTVAYAIAGAVAAASVGLVAQLGQWTPALRPLWTLLHLAGLGLGLWLLWRGRQPAWLERWGRDAAGQRTGGWQAVQGPMVRAGAGLAWVAWPCGLLQSALLTAALANGPLGGATAMAGFAVASSWGLAAAPALWAWARRHPGLDTLAVRLAGALLAAASLWAVAHDLIVRAVAWCLS